MAVPSVVLSYLSSIRLTVHLPLRLVMDLQRLDALSTVWPTGQCFLHFSTLVTIYASFPLSKFSVPVLNSRSPPSTTLQLLYSANLSESYNIQVLRYSYPISTFPLYPSPSPCVIRSLSATLSADAHTTFTPSIHVQAMGNVVMEYKRRPSSLDTPVPIMVAIAPEKTTNTGTQESSRTPGRRVDYSHRLHYGDHVPLPGLDAPDLRRTSFI